MNGDVGQIDFAQIGLDYGPGDCTRHGVVPPRFQGADQVWPNLPGYDIDDSVEPLRRKGG